jgi:hypothetical protein
MRSVVHSSGFTLIVILFSTATLGAQTKTDVSGHWEGGIHTPEMSISIQVDLTNNSAGQLAGTISVPPQNLKGLPLVIESAEGQTINFRFRGAPGNRLFQGVISDDGASIRGSFMQSGYTMPFTLSRTGAAQIDAPVRSAPISKALEGPWSATLEGTYQNGIQRKIILTLENRPDGTSTGQVFNPGDGLEIPIASITQNASSVTLDLRAVGGSYSGRVNTEGTEMVGTFIQGTTVLPLTFRRAPAAESPQ